MTGAFQPRPYVPRFSVRRDVRPVDDDIDFRGRSRLYHQCYKRCGFSHDDFAVLNEHEDHCTKTPRPEET